MLLLDGQLVETITSRHFSSQATGTGFGCLRSLEQLSSICLYNGLGTLTSAGTLPKSTNLASVSVVGSSSGTNPGAHESKAGYGLLLARDDTDYSATENIRTALLRLDSVSNQTVGWVLHNLLFQAVTR